MRQHSIFIRSDDDEQSQHEEAAGAAIGRVSIHVLIFFRVFSCVAACVSLHQPNRDYYMKGLSTSAYCWVNEINNLQLALKARGANNAAAEAAAAIVAASYALPSPSSKQSTSVSRQGASSSTRS